MLQYALLALAVICGTTNAGYSSTNQQTYTGTYGTGQGGASAGAGAGAATGGVFGNNYGAGAGYGNQFPYPNYNAFQQQQFPTFPQQGNFHLNPQLSAFFDNFWKQFGQNSQNLYQQQLAHQQALFNQWQHAAGSQYGGQYGGAYGGAGAAGGVPTGFYAPNFAASSGSVGPGGIHQTATLIPANPNSPNVDTRFGGDETPIVTVSSGPQGFKGVSTSSFSSSSDINGQKTSHREASTSVNDNGKVTTYTVRS